MTLRGGIAFPITSEKEMGTSPLGRIRRGKSVNMPRGRFRSRIRIFPLFRQEERLGGVMKEQRVPVRYEEGKGNSRGLKEKGILPWAPKNRKTQAT